MRFAMLPADEAAAVELLVREWNLSLLASDVLVAGAPRVVADEPFALPEELPTRQAGLREYLFWHESWGVNALPPDDSATGRVATLLTSDHAARVGEGDADLLDTARTPIIRLRRATWQDDGSLAPAALQAMSIPRPRQPERLLSLHRKIENRLRRLSTRVDVASQTSDRHRPAIYAMPAAATWIGEGGLVHPWS